MNKVRCSPTGVKKRFDSLNVSSCCDSTGHWIIKVSMWPVRNPFFQFVHWCAHFRSLSHCVLVNRKLYNYLFKRSQLALKANFFRHSNLGRPLPVAGRAGTGSHHVDANLEAPRLVNSFSIGRNSFPDCGTRGTHGSSRPPTPHFFHTYSTSEKEVAISVVESLGIVAQTSSIYSAP